MTQDDPEARYPATLNPATLGVARLAASCFLCAILTFWMPAAVALAQEAEGQPEETEGQTPKPEGETSDQAPAEAASTRDGRRIQDWTLRCRQPDPDGPELCEMFQRHVDDRGNVVLHAVIGKLPDSRDPGFLVILPLGISLPPGTFMRIDDGDDVAVPVERCVAQGCRLELLIDQNLMGLLRRGREATVSFHAYDQQGQVQRVSIPISLMGFTSALNEVMQ